MFEHPGELVAKFEPPSESVANLEPPQRRRNKRPNPRMRNFRLHWNWNLAYEGGRGPNHLPRISRPATQVQFFLMQFQ